MTTIKPAIEIGARAAVARRTEELFRSSGALARGPLPAEERPPRRRLRREVRGPVGSGGDERAVRVLGGRVRRRRRRGRRVDLVAGPTTGGVILAFETGRQLGVRAIFAEEVRDADGATQPRVPARLPDRARRAGPARRRHPDDRRLAAGDAARGRGDGRRDRRVRGPRRPQPRRDEHPDLADERARLPAPLALAARPARPTSPAPEPARAAPTAPRSTRRGAAGPEHDRAGPRGPTRPRVACSSCSPRRPSSWPPPWRQRSPSGGPVGRSRPGSSSPSRRPA